MTLCTACVGVGHLGRHHARLHHALAREGKNTFAFVCDQDAETAHRIGAEHETPWVTDWRQLLQGETRVDAISLAAPTEAHCEIASAFLSAGIHVLVEKPIARTLEEADEMIAAAERGRALLQIGHLERFNPALVALRPHVRAPLYFEIHRVGQFTARSLDIDVVLDLMIHDLDIVQWLVGYDVEVTDVRAVGIPVLTHRIDAANARIEFASGAVANITASRIGTEKIRKMRFFQPHDYIVVDYQTRFASISSLAPPAGEARPGVHTRRPEIIDIEPLRAEIEVFFAAVETGAPSPVAGWEGRRALAVAQEVLTCIGAHARQAGMEFSV
jgi:predicted dehydrogenase